MAFTYSLDNDAGGLFSIDPNTGALSVKAPVSEPQGSILTPILRAIDQVSGLVTVQPLQILISGIYVPPVIPPTLAALGLSNTSATAGSSFTASISGQTAGSTITASSSDGTPLAISGGAILGTFAAAGTPTITLTETLVGAIGSPRATQVQISVSAAPPAPAFGVLVFSTSAASGLHPAL